PDMPPQHHNALQIIRRSGEYLADLIEGLLDISKIEAGRLEIYRNRISFPELIAQMEMLFREQALAKGISFRCHVHNTLPQITSTPSWVISSRAFSANSGQSEAGSTTTASSFLPSSPPFLFCSSTIISTVSFSVVSLI